MHHDQISDEKRELCYVLGYKLWVRSSRWNSTSRCRLFCVCPWLSRPRAERSEENSKMVGAISLHLLS